MSSYSYHPCGNCEALYDRRDSHCPMCKVENTGAPGYDWRGKPRHWPPSPESQEGTELHRYAQGLLEEAEATDPAEPRPTKGKFEPQHLFNSRMREWRRRNA